MLLAAHACRASIFRANEPLLVNDTALISGSFAADTVASVCDTTGSCFPCPLLLPTPTSAKFLLPPTLASGSTLSVSLTSASTGARDEITFNVPTLDWVLADGALENGTFVLGRSLRLFGRSLAWSPSGASCPALTPGSPATPGSAARVFAVPAGALPTSSPVFMPVTLASCFRVDATLPSDAGVVLGAAYDIYIHNGLTGPGLVPGPVAAPHAALVATLTAVADPADAWPSRVFTVPTSPGCATVAACLATAGAAGGGTVAVPAGTLYMSGVALEFPPASSVALVGAGMDATALVWPIGGSLPLVGSAIVTGASPTARWRIADMTIAVLTGATGGPQPPGPALPVVFINASVGVVLERVRITEDLSASPEFIAGNPVRVFDSARVTLHDCEFSLVGQCGAKWPANTALSVHNSSDVSILGSRFASSCQGWCVTSTSRVMIADSSFVSTGDVSQGSGIGSDGGPPGVCEHLYFGNNSDVGNADAHMRWESFTYDGSGGAYNGTATQAGTLPDGRATVTLSGRVACKKALADGCVYRGSSLAVMRGLGTGQWRRIASVMADGVTVVLEDGAFDPLPAFGDAGSYLSISPLAGQSTFEGNTWVNGTTFQTYGESIDLIFAGNTMTEMFTTQWMNTTQVAAGLRLFGHRYQGGYEQNWRSLIEGNVLDCITQFLVYADNIDNVSFALGHVVRRNTVRATSLDINFLHDGVIEGNSFEAARCAWAGRDLPAGRVNINATSTGVVVRGNTVQRMQRSDGVEPFEVKVSAPVAPPLFGARRRRVPPRASTVRSSGVERGGGQAIRSHSSIGDMPRSVTTPSSDTVTLIFNISSPASWWTGVSILSDNATLVQSFGNWYNSPYPFFTALAPLATGVATSPTPTVPGTVFASRGVAAAAGFSGQDFNDYEGVFATLDASGHVWESRAPGVEGTWWEVSAPIRVSQNGSLVAFARTAMDHYDPLGPKHAEVAVLDTSTFPPLTLLTDAFANGTGLEDVLLSDDGATLVAIAAIDPTGSINSSEVRVYKVGAAGSTRVSTFVTGYVFSSCLSSDGRWLVLATCDSENAVEVFAINSDGTVSQTANSSYPVLPGTFTFAAVCAVSNSGSAWVVWPLWWGGAINATAVAFYGALPATPTPPGAYLAPTSLWLSPPISPALQDDIIEGVYLEPAGAAPGAFAFTSWGGAPLIAGALTPPTLRVFSDADPSSPIAQLSTPSADGSCSGSLEGLDVARNSRGDLVVVAAGLDNHANIGSSGGRLWSWLIALDPPQLFNATK